MALGFDRADRSHYQAVLGDSARARRVHHHGHCRRTSLDPRPGSAAETPSHHRARDLGIEGIGQMPGGLDAFCGARRTVQVQQNRLRGLHGELLQRVGMNQRSLSTSGPRRPCAALVRVDEEAALRSSTARNHTGFASQLPFQNVAGSMQTASRPLGNENGDTRLPPKSHGGQRISPMPHYVKKACAQLWLVK